jgi:hypothetical protein
MEQVSGGERPAGPRPVARTDRSRGASFDRRPVPACSSHQAAPLPSCTCTRRHTRGGPLGGVIRSLASHATRRSSELPLRRTGLAQRPAAGPVPGAAGLARRPAGPVAVSPEPSGAAVVRRLARCAQHVEALRQETQRDERRGLSGQRRQLAGVGGQESRPPGVPCVSRNPSFPVSRLLRTPARAGVWPGCPCRTAPPQS